MRLASTPQLKLYRSAFLVTALLVVGVLAPALPARAQVRSVVLENPSRPGELADAPLFPPRKARLSMRWEVPSGGTVLDGMLGGPGGIVYAVREGRVRSLGTTDGALAWERTFEEEILHPPAGLVGRIAILTERRLLILAAQDGRTLWETSLAAPPLQPATLARGYVVVALASGGIEAYDLDSGAPRWRVGPFCALSAPLGTGGAKLVAGCADGLVLGLDLGTGQVAWRRRLGAGILARPAVDVGRVLLGNAKRELVALGLKKGRRRYTVRLAAQLAASPKVREGLVLAGAMDNLIYALRRRNGHLAWTADAGARVVSAPAVRDGIAVASPPLATVITVIDMRDGAILALHRYEPEDRHSAAGPLWAGDLLVGSTRSLAGGSGWVAGYQVEVVELDPALAPRPLRAP